MKDDLTHDLTPQPPSRNGKGEEEGGIKDANDLLKRWAAEGVEAEEQRRRVRELLDNSLPMVVKAARWAGKLGGPERDRAVRTVFGMVAQMERVEAAQYRSQLAKALGIGVREFNDITKAAKGAGGEERPDVVETLGGLIEGWLVEYVYDPGEDRARLAFRDVERRIGIADFLDLGDKRYVPKPVNDFVREGAVLFASEIGAKMATRDLVSIVEAFIHEHYLLEHRYLGRIMAYYVMLTWVYDSFNALCYLRAIGEAGSGKSELMKRIGSMCYRLLTSSGASSFSSFFRVTEMYKGTVFIDEADLEDGGDMTNYLIKFINQGAMKNSPIWRVVEVMGENGRTFEVETYQTYCPKLFAMRRDFKDDAVASRSLTIKLMPREPIELKAKGVKLYIDEEFRQRSLKIRNLLLRWRLEHWEPEIDVTEELMDLDISSRLNQVTMPLKALAKDDPELMAEIEKFLRIYNQEMVLSRSMTIAARVVEAMWKIIKFPDLRLLHLKKSLDGDAEYMMIGDVRKIANQIMDEMNAGDDEDKEDEGAKRRRKKDELSAKGVGSIIRNELQLQVGQRRGSGFPVFWDEIKMLGLAKRYGIDPETVGPQSSNGTQPAAEQRKMDLNGYG